MRKWGYKLLLIGIVFSFCFPGVSAEEFTSSDNTYKINFDDNGAGYLNNDSSSIDQSNTYLLSGSIESFDSGEGDTTGSTGGDYKLLSGLQPSFQANVPSIALLQPFNTGNTVSFYDRFRLVLNPNGNPTSATGTLFAVQITQDSSFSSYMYVNPSTFQPDFVPNPSLITYYQPCAQTTNQPADETRWDCGTVGGMVKYITGLQPATEYYVRAVAMNGDFTNTQTGPSIQSTTSSMNLSLSTNSQNSSFGLFNPAAVNAATPSPLLTVETNAVQGYTVSVLGTGDGSNPASSLYSTASGHSILSSNGNLDTIIGQEGYGMQCSVVYGTPAIASAWDATLGGRNSSYAGQILRSNQILFSSTSPTDESISGDRITTSFKSTVSAGTPASNDYRDTLIFTLVGNF